MIKVLLLCLFGMSLSFGDLNFDALEEKEPTSSSISVDMSDGVKAANGQWKKKVAENEAEAERYRRTHPHTSSSYLPCYSGDTCYQVLEVIESRRYKIKCTRGSQTGNIYEVCGNHKGKWATGCGITDAFAHHYRSMSEAANRRCDL